MYIFPGHSRESAFTDRVWFRNHGRIADPPSAVLVCIATTQTLDPSLLWPMNPQITSLPFATRHHIWESPLMPTPHPTHLLISQVKIAMTLTFRNIHSSRRHLAEVSDNRCVRESSLVYPDSLFSRHLPSLPSVCQKERCDM